MPETELKQCPFCGQYMMCGDGCDIREVCSCDGAKKYQTYKIKYDNQTSRLEKLCGEGCSEDSDTPEEIRAIFKPVSEEAYKLLEDVLYSVVFRHIGKTRVELTDGTTVTISPDTIERKATVKNKLG
ncbi:MAG: hypothetical protein ACI4N6_05245 [Eubacteriales bacterium]